MGNPRKKVKDYKGDLIPGRDKDGKFLPGVTVASPRPRPVELMHLKVLHDVFTEKEFTKICKLLLEECLEKQPWAMKLLFDRLIPADWLDRIKEQDLERRRIVHADYSPEFIKAMENEARRKIKAATGSQEAPEDREAPTGAVEPEKVVPEGSGGHPEHPEGNGAAV